MADTKQALNQATLNIRLPGQYFDLETGLHDNWHRTYNPQTGRVPAVCGGAGRDGWGRRRGVLERPGCGRGSQCGLSVPVCSRSNRAGQCERRIPLHCRKRGHQVGSLCTGWIYPHVPQRDGARLPRRRWNDLLVSPEAGGSRGVPRSTRQIRRNRVSGGSVWDQLSITQGEKS